MEFFVAVRTERCYVDLEWLERKISGANQFDYSGVVYGPFVTITEADEQYEKILDWVDDDDYGIYARDDKNRWWLIRTHRNGHCSYRRLTYPSEWHETLTAAVGLAIKLRQ